MLTLTGPKSNLIVEKSFQFDPNQLALYDNAELSDDDLFNDDDLLDDVLTSDLEESLDDELETFADLEDDMLVPDDGGDDLFEAGDDEVDQSELDSLCDDDDLSDKVLNVNDGISR